MITKYLKSRLAVYCSLSFFLILDIIFIIKELDLTVDSYFFALIIYFTLREVRLKNKGQLLYWSVFQAFVFVEIVHVASGFREIVIFEQLSKIPTGVDLDPKTLKWLTPPSQYFCEPLFRGNILSPWIPSKRPEFPISWPNFCMIIAVVLFLLQFYLYCKTDESVDSKSAVG